MPQLRGKTLSDRARRLGTILLLFVSTLPADGPLINVVGPTEFEIDAQKPTETVEISPSIAVVIQTDASTAGVRSLNPVVAAVSVGTVVHPAYGNAFAFEPITLGAKGELRWLKGKVNLALIPDSGTYIVRILLVADGAPTLAPQSLDLKVTRPSGTLSLSPLRVEVTNWLPFFKYATLSPNQFKFQETSGRATLEDVQIEMKGSLTSADNSPVAAQLQVSEIKEIQAGHEILAGLELQGDPPLNLMKGTLLLRCRQLSQPIEANIEVVDRLSRFWLVVTLFLSIGLGYVVRNLLDKRNVQYQSLLSAERQFGVIKETRDTSIAPSVTQSLDKVLGNLRKAIEAKPFVATTVDTAAKDSSDAFAKVLAQAEADRAQQRSRIKELRVTLDSSVGQPIEVASKLDDLIERLREQEIELNKGGLDSVQSEVDKVGDEIKNAIPTVVQAWAQKVHDSAIQIGEWRTLEFEAVRRKVLDETQSTAAATLDLAKTRALAREIQVFFVNPALRQVANLSGRVVEFIVRLTLSDNDLENALEQSRKCLLGVRNLSGAGLDELEPVAEIIGAMRTALTTAVEIAARVKKIPRPGELDEGDFWGALAKLSGPTIVPESNFPEAVADYGTLRSQPPEITLRPAIAERNDAWDLLLEVSANQTVDEQGLAAVTIIGKPSGPLDFEWTLGDQTLNSLSATQAFTPKLPGRFPIFIRAVARLTGETRSARAVVQVRPSHGFMAASGFAARLALGEGIQTLVSAFFIAWAGYVIFQANWFGSAMDFVAGSLWGFSVDLGIAKVRDLAGPLTGRAIPLPGGK